MKHLLILLLLGFSTYTSARDCGPGTIQAWDTATGSQCVPRVAKSEPEYLCLPVTTPLQSNWMEAFPSLLIQTEKMPYWVSQGNLLYPNLRYPGPWVYPGIEAKYYPGEGEIFAAKPNVYIESVHADKKFKFEFTSETKPHFLATTPVLEKEAWKGKIVGKDKFEVDGVNYEYLFYDVRLPKEKMQFEHGVCATREAAIEWMMKDLKEMSYSELSLQDFEEHWRVKIPDYPFYCIYPQYNRELDPILPVELELEQSTFIRSLYVLIPYKTEPDIDELQEVPLPQKDPSTYRPVTKIQRENTFREWGVAFFGF